MLTHRLTHRIAIQEATETQDTTTGAVSVSWGNATLGGVEMSAVPAEVLTGPGREFRESGAEQAETTARINTRWFPGLTSKMRIVWDGKTYNIKSIETDATGRREYRLRCTEGVNAG